MYITLWPQTIRTLLSKGIRKPKLNRWSLELADYNISFVHIKGKDNILAGTISRSKTLDIYKEVMENLKTPAFNNSQGHIMEIYATYKHTVSTTVIHTKQRGNIMCKKLV